MESKIRRIIKEIKNLKNDLNSDTRNEHGINLSKKKNDKIRLLIEAAKKEGILTEEEIGEIEEFLNQQAIKIVIEVLSKKIGSGRDA